MLKVMTASIASAVFVVLSSGCNTVAGVGKDVEKVGEKTQEVSKDASKDLKKDKDKK